MNEIFSNDVFSTLGVAVQQGMEVWILADEYGDMENLQRHQLASYKNTLVVFGNKNEFSNTRCINKKIVVAYSFDNLHFQYVNGEYM